MERGSIRPQAPRLPKDLSACATLSEGIDVAHVSIAGNFTDLQGRAITVRESRIGRSSFIGADLSRLRLIDVVVEGADFSGADLYQASFTRVSFLDCRLSSALMPETQLRDVSFSECRLDSVNLRMANADTLLFDNVDLKQADLGSSVLHGACFFDCDLSEVDVSHATLPGARLHGSLLADMRGCEYLRDVVIANSQLFPLAHGVFRGLGIAIEDEREVT